MWNWLVLFFTLMKKDIKVLELHGYAKPKKVLHRTFEKTIFTPDGYPCEYCQFKDFEEKIWLLLEDGKIVLLTKRYGESFSEIEFSIQEENKECENVCSEKFENWFYNNGKEKENKQ